MSNSDLIDCTRESEKWRMRDCKRGGDIERERQIKKKRGHRLQERGGIESEGKKIRGRDVMDG